MAEFSHDLVYYLCKNTVCTTILAGIVGKENSFTFLERWFVRLIGCFAWLVGCLHWLGTDGWVRLMINIGSSVVNGKDHLFDLYYVLSNDMPLTMWFFHVVGSYTLQLSTSTLRDVRLSHLACYFLSKAFLHTSQLCHSSWSFLQSFPPSK